MIAANRGEEKRMMNAAMVEAEPRKFSALGYFKMLLNLQLSRYGFIISWKKNGYNPPAGPTLCRFEKKARPRFGRLFSSVL